MPSVGKIATQGFKNSSIRHVVWNALLFAVSKLACQWMSPVGLTSLLLHENVQLPSGLWPLFSNRYGKSRHGSRFGLYKPEGWEAVEGGTRFLCSHAMLHDRDLVWLSASALTDWNDRGCLIRIWKCIYLKVRVSRGVNTDAVSDTRSTES